MNSNTIIVPLKSNNHLLTLSFKYVFTSYDTLLRFKYPEIETISFYGFDQFPLI